MEGRFAIKFGAIRLSTLINHSPEEPNLRAGFSGMRVARVLNGGKMPSSLVNFLTQYARQY